MITGWSDIRGEKRLSNVGESPALAGGRNGSVKGKVL
jgi:hypothetical protein